MAARRPYGFTLVEVMVALAVTAFGLLGLAKLQAVAFAGAKVAGSRTIAAVQAEGMASAMHANVGYWQTAAAVTAAPVTIRSNGAISLGTTVDCATASCTPAQIATYDLATFGRQLAAQLPPPLTTQTPPVSISCTAAPTSFATNPNVCTITVSWSEQYTAAPGTSPLQATQSTQSYSMVVQP